MKNIDSPLAIPSKQELKRPFPLIQDLFALAKKNKIASRGENEAVALPEAFAPLVADYPGKYYVVAYEDRRDTSYAEDTRGQFVTLATVKAKAETDKLTHEFFISQKQPARADRIEVSLRKAVMDKSFEKINEAEGEALEQSHGTMVYTYELDENGEKFPQKIEYNRLDEGLFKIGDKLRPVRWVRTLEVEKKEGQPEKIFYSDFYTIRENDDNPAKNPRANVRTIITEKSKDTQMILVEVGSGPEKSARIIADDKSKGVKILVHDYLKGQDPLAIIKDDPLYAPLFKKTADIDAFLDGLKFRIQNLKEDWDKPQSVYETGNKLNPHKPELSAGN